MRYAYDSVYGHMPECGREEGLNAMAMTTEESEVEIREVSPEEAWEIFDQAAQYYLKMSGRDFLDRWDSGQFGDPDDQPDIMPVVALLPIVREE